MRDKKDNNVYLLHIKDCIDKIFSYTRAHSFEDFSKSEWDQDAVMRNLEIIGEAANNLEKDFQLKYSEVPWRNIIGLRNVLIHDYVDVDVQIVWKIITSDLVMFGQQIQEILAKE